MVENVDDRKAKILRAIIHEHILTAEPVGSRTLAKSYELGVSSATIRNEMSDLEELGFIEQPYTSAGRVPSDKGYRFYVDSLIKSDEHDKSKINFKNFFDNYHYEKQGIQNIMNQMARMLSQITHYTSVVCEPKVVKNKIKQVQLMQIDNTSILIVLITDTGLVHNKIVRLKNRLNRKQIAYLNNFLSEELRNKNLEDINSGYLKGLEEELLSSLKISRELLELIYNGLTIVSKPDDFKLYLGGTSYILDQPEFNDIDSLKRVLNILDQEELLKELFAKMPNKELEVMIGHENDLADMHKCSIVFSTYSIGNKASGKIAVIGPRRMEYSKVMASVNTMSNLISKIISELSG
ncbi:heat-inducible transcriptional repressor HrcA [Natronospora cellulosivora (SeqCode)]